MVCVRYRPASPALHPSGGFSTTTQQNCPACHPHVHVLAAAGVFAPNVDFHLAPSGGWQELAELWRHTVLRRLRDAGALADWQMRAHHSWSPLRPTFRLISAARISSLRKN